MFSDLPILFISVCLIQTAITNPFIFSEIALTFSLWFPSHLILNLIVFHITKREEDRWAKEKGKTVLRLLTTFAGWCGLYCFFWDLVQCLVPELFTLGQCKYNHRLQNIPPIQCGVHQKASTPITHFHDCIHPLFQQLSPSPHPSPSVMLHIMEGNFLCPTPIHPDYGLFILPSFS